jgi:ComEC/Rec2-related protein
MAESQRQSEIGVKQPLATTSLLYVGGILLAYLWPLPLTYLFGAALALAWVAVFYARARPLLLIPALVLAGWANLAWRMAVLSPHDLRRLIGEQPELMTLRGTLCATPAMRVLKRREEEVLRSVAEVEVMAIQRGGLWQRASGRVVITTPGLLPEPFFGGQRVEVSGVLGPPKGPVAEGLFDYRAYLRWQGIYYQLQVENTNDWRLVRHPAGPDSPPLSDRFCRWAQATLRRGLAVEDENVRLLWAMALGWKTALTDEVSEPFMRTGTMHIFAISGLHIALIAGILVSVLRVLQIPRGACGWVVIPLIWFYTAATGWQSSAIRSTLMMSIIIAGWALRRPGDLLNSLAAAGLLLLLWEPRQLFQASFQLSFFVVLSIALLLPPFEKTRQRLLQTDPFMPAELRPRWQRWLDKPIRYVTTSFATSLAAWIGSLPLIAYYFHLFTPISLLANLIIVPVSSAALACALGSLICGSWLVQLTELFNHSGWFWMQLMVSLSEWLAKVPGGYWYVRGPRPLEFVIFYGLVFAALTGWQWARQRRLWAGVGIGLMAGIWFGHHFWERGQIHLTVLAVGGGDALFFDVPGRRNDLLIDCGNDSAAAFVVVPFLHGQGVNRLSQCLLTHGDIRHVGGAELVRRELSPRQYLASSVRFRSSAYRQLLAQLTASGQPCRRVHRGDRLGQWTVLHPAADDRFSLADDSALVLRGELNGTRLLLLSDLGKQGQATLLERGGDLAADCVVAGLPSNSEPLNAALLEAVRPRLVIVSTANFPANEQAKPQLRERLARRGIPIVYTSEAGSVRLELRSQGWRLRSMAGTNMHSSLAKSPAQIRLDRLAGIGEIKAQ